MFAGNGLHHGIEGWALADGRDPFVFEDLDELPALEFAELLDLFDLGLDAAWGFDLLDGGDSGVAEAAQWPVCGNLLYDNVDHNIGLRYHWRDSSILEA